MDAAGSGDPYHTDACGDAQHQTDAGSDGDTLDVTITVSSGIDFSEAVTGADVSLSSGSIPSDIPDLTSSSDDDSSYDGEDEGKGYRKTLDTSKNGKHEDDSYGKTRDGSGDLKNDGNRYGRARDASVDWENDGERYGRTRDAPGGGETDWGTGRGTRDASGDREDSRDSVGGTPTTRLDDDAFRNLLTRTETKRLSEPAPADSIEFDESTETASRRDALPGRASVHTPWISGISKLSSAAGSAALREGGQGEATHPPAASALKDMLLSLRCFQEIRAEDERAAADIPNTDQLAVDPASRGQALAAKYVAGTMAGSLESTAAALALPEFPGGGSTEPDAITNSFEKEGLQTVVRRISHISALDSSRAVPELNLRAKSPRGAELALATASDCYDDDDVAVAGGDVLTWLSSRGDYAAAEHDSYLLSLQSRLLRLESANTSAQNSGTEGATARRDAARGSLPIVFDTSEIPEFEEGAYVGTYRTAFSLPDALIGGRLLPAEREEEEGASHVPASSPTTDSGQSTLRSESESHRWTPGGATSTFDALTKLRVGGQPEVVAVYSLPTVDRAHAPAESEASVASSSSTLTLGAGGGNAPDELSTLSLSTEAGERRSPRRPASAAAAPSSPDIESSLSPTGSSIARSESSERGGRPTKAAEEDAGKGAAAAWRRETGADSTFRTLQPDATTEQTLHDSTGFASLVGPPSHAGPLDGPPSLAGPPHDAAARASSESRPIGGAGGGEVRSSLEARPVTTMRVVTPKEIFVIELCCVGATVKRDVDIYNPNDKWVVVTLAFSPVVQIDGKQVDMATRPQVLLLKRRCVLASLSTETVEIEYCPTTAGKYESEVIVTSHAVVEDPAFKSSSVSIPICAQAVAPKIQIEDGGTSAIDLGTVHPGSKSVATINVLNRSFCKVPVAIVLSSSTRFLHCLQFVGGERRIQKVLPAGGCEKLEIDCQLLSKDIDSENAKICDVLGRLEIDLDGPGYVQLACRDLKITAGVVKLSVIGDVKEVNMERSSEKSLALYNGGTLAVVAECSVSTAADAFSVDCSRFRLAPGETHSITLTCSEPGASARGMLCITTQPAQADKILVELVAKAMTKLLCNRSFVFWGGQWLGEDAQRVVTFRNPSSTQPFSFTAELKLRASCFKIQLKDGAVVSRQHIVVPPGGDIPLTVIFSPDGNTSYRSKLYITDDSSRMKYSIVLLGYGGCGRVLPGGLAQETRDVYVYELSRGQQFVLHNIGIRSAFVHLAPASAAADDDDTAESSVGKIIPDKFVIAPKDFQTVVFTNDTSSKKRGAIVVSYGDEVIRRRLKQLLKIGQPIPEAYSQLHVDTEYRHEESPVEECKIPDLPASTLLKATLRTFTVKVIDDRPTTGGHFHTDQTGFHSLIHDATGLDSTAASVNTSCLLDKPVRLQTPGVWNQQKGRPPLSRTFQAETPAVQKHMQEHSSLVATPTKSRVDASGPETRAAILHDVIAPQEIMFPNTFIGGVGELSWSIVDMRAAAAVAAEANVAVQLFPLEPTYMMVGAGPMQPSSSMVFHVAKSAWTVQYGGTTTVPVRFTPMNAGRYHQIWKVELSLGTRTEVRTLRIYGDGTKRAIPTTATSGYKPVTARQQELDFGSVDLGSTSKLKLQICNKTDCNYALNVALPSPPFNVSDKNKHVSLKSHHFVSLPIYFRPNRTGVYCHTLTIDVQDQDSLSVQLKGECKIH